MNVRVSTGDTVSIAQTIAEVGPVSSYYSEEGTNLYFAITKDGEPVNPLTLIQ
jgi:septal ring factor EnvC (AmiA/AmiB activator)